MSKRDYIKKYAGTEVEARFYPDFNLLLRSLQEAGSMHTPTNSSVPLPAVIP
jgi:hypothetical protein